VVSWQAQWRENGDRTPEWITSMLSQVAAAEVTAFELGRDACPNAELALALVSGFARGTGRRPGHGTIPLAGDPLALAQVESVRELDALTALTVVEADRYASILGPQTLPDTYDRFAADPGYVAWRLPATAPAGAKWRPQRFRLC
jgi:hypothetical protein